MVNFSEWLKAELKKRNLLQKELAGMMDVSEGIVSRYVLGKDIPSPINLIKLAKALNLPEKEVLAIGGYDENFRKLPTHKVFQKNESVTQNEVDLDDPLDRELLSLCSRFENIFLDKRGALDKESKEVLINILKFVLKREEEHNT